MIPFAEACVENTGILSCSARSCTASITELWNWPITALTLSCDASFLSPATPFSGVPESSSMTSSIFRPPGTPPGPLISSAAILAPRTMNWPAPASPGGDSGVSTPILTGPWARVGVRQERGGPASRPARGIWHQVPPLGDRVIRAHGMKGRMASRVVFVEPQDLLPCAHARCPRWAARAH